MYPVILGITLITLASFLLTGFILLRQNNIGEEKRKITVGLVGNTKDTYFETGITALKNADSSKFFVSFPEMSEKDAQTALKKREIDAYVYIPDNFIKGIYYGKNIPAQYVTLSKPTGFGGALMNEVVTLLSNIVVETQNGMYSMQNVAASVGNDENLDEKVTDLNVTYLSFVLNRNKVYSLNVLGVSDMVSIEGYYICGIIVFFLLIWGIACGKMLLSKNMSLLRSINISGIDAKNQILSEYGAFFAITLLTLLIFAVAFGSVVTYNSFGISELSAATVGSSVAFVIKMIPVIAMITAMHKAFYEFVSDIVSGILLQFILAVGLGYISGCFYPNTFFPDSLQRFAEILPVGAGFAYLRRLMSETLTFSDFAVSVAYTAIFIFLAVTVRKHRILGGRK